VAIAAVHVLYEFAHRLDEFTHALLHKIKLRPEAFSSQL
jgi:hypothetical protein